MVIAPAIPKADILNLEDYKMYSAHRFVASLFLAAAVAAPVSIMAIPVPQEGRDQKEARDQNRVYDKGHKDYHNWDDNENRAWGQYLTENHKKSHEFSKSNSKEQSHYWNWRHAHPDKN
jgi:hypothetical protein